MKGTLFNLKTHWEVYYLPNEFSSFHEKLRLSVEDLHKMNNSFHTKDVEFEIKQECEWDKGRPYGEYYDVAKITWI